MLFFFIFSFHSFWFIFHLFSARYLSPTTRKLNTFQIYLYDLITFAFQCLYLCLHSICICSICCCSSFIVVLCIFFINKKKLTKWWRIHSILNSCIYTAQRVYVWDCEWLIIFLWFRIGFRVWKASGGWASLIEVWKFNTACHSTYISSSLRSII